MESNVSNAVVLLFIGMITVTVVLLLVVLTGKLVIRVANSYAPTPIVENKSLPFKRKPGTDPKLVAVLAAVVQNVTNGEGHVTSIKKSKT